MNQVQEILKARTLREIYHTLYSAASTDNSLGPKELTNILDKLTRVVDILEEPRDSRTVQNVTQKKVLQISDVTVLLDFTAGFPPKIFLTSMLENLIGIYPELNTLIGITPDQAPQLKSLISELHIKNTSQIKHIEIKTPNPLPGTVWNALVSNVTTAVVLIGKDLIFFDMDAQLEMSLESLQSLGVPIVGGAYRYTNGHWYIGCQQSAMRNYSLVYASGYDKSKSSCVYCDHIDGPFMAYTDLIVKIPFSEVLNNHTLYNDYFLSVSLRGYESIICPNSMFHLKDRKDTFAVQSWIDFANKWRFDHIVIDSVKIQIPCAEQTFKCSGSRLNDLREGIGLPPCCLQELADQIKFLMTVSEQHGIISAVAAGNLLGALKFNGILPWELDADIFFDNTGNASYSVIKSIESFFNNAGYGIIEQALKSKAFNLYKKGSSWTVEWYGGLHRRNHTPPYYKNLGIEPTKINLDGSWLRTFANPALTSWLDYKPEIFRHSQHNRVHNIRYNAQYKPRDWLECKKPAPGRHNCLEQYPTDGNLPFRDPRLHG